MKKKTYLLVIAAAILTFSCAKNVAEESAPVPEGFITVKCTLANPLENNDPTKVTLTHEGNAGKTRWEDGDEVLFHGKKMGVSGDDVYSYVATAQNISADGKTASFTIPDLAVKYDEGNSYVSSIFAIYPASAVYNYSNSTSWYYISAFKETNHLLMAGYNLHKTTDPYSFYFVNLTGALSFQVSGDFDAYRVVGNNDEVLGWDKYTVAVAQCDWGKEHRTCYRGSSGPGGSSGPQTYVYVAPTDPAWKNGTTINTVYFPGTGDGSDLDGDGTEWNEAANFTAGFTIKFYKNGVEVKRVSTDTPKNIQIGKWLDLGNITDHLIDPPSAAAHTPATWTTGAEDLVVSNPANCYIVYTSKAGKALKIPAVKGKSTESVGAIASVSILWETYNSTSEAVTANSVIADVDYDDSYIYFKMPESSDIHTGNALIAAKDEYGTILWSWHIWVPSSVITPISDTDFAATAVMDRNLGAIEPVVAGSSAVPVSSFGLYYQWGRKDPFMTDDWLRNTSVSFSYTSTRVTTETAIQNPTVFYKGKDESTTPPTYNWNSSEISTLWDAGDHKKTIYDPCPEGYKVGVYDDTKRMWKHSDTSNWTADTTYGWLKYGDNLIFPLAGYTETLSSYRVKLRALLWSATYLSFERANALYTDPKPSYNSYYKLYGASIRCVAE